MMVKIEPNIDWYFFRCLDSFDEHAVHCKELPGFKYRHNLVGDVLCDVLKRANISAKKEAHVNFLTDPLEGRSTLRPADILVFGWEGGKHSCVDLTCLSPLVGLRDTGFVAGQAALKAESDFSPWLQGGRIRNKATKGYDRRRDGVWMSEISRQEKEMEH
ncbi:hypothetical protein R6Q59_005066 [Mikania micrantha]